ncbi:DUF1592 domain-containing protein [bacterium]|nr:DUF1592 domain-containing protein [bacterium]
MISVRKARCLVSLAILLCSLSSVALGQNSENETASLSLEELKAAGAARSSYRKLQRRSVNTDTPEPQLATFRQDIEPILKAVCVACHGPDLQEGNIRIDTLNPDLLHGDDIAWWLEIMAVLSKGEMPPVDADELADADRSKLVDWLSSEILVASQVRRARQGHSSFRRMTRYEYRYALQDLLGLTYDFARDLPPEAASEDGFQNSSEMLHMTAAQFGYYRELARDALLAATVRGEQPALLEWGISMEEASADSWAEYGQEQEKIRQQHKDDPEKLKQELEQLAEKHQGRLGAAHYKDLTTGLVMRAEWRYNGAKFAFLPQSGHPETPAVAGRVAIIPRGQKLIVELGDQIPETGTLRVRVRACRASPDDAGIPSLQLEFGWQASNDSQASVRISDHDLAIDAAQGEPQFYQWEIPLREVYPRNSVRKISKMGDLPSPSEYLKFVNSSVSQGDIQIDYVEVTAPVYAQWPPASHRRIFIDSPNRADEDEAVYAREVLTNLMTRAWRRRVTVAEVDQKLALFTKIRPECEDFQAAMIEVLSTVLSSPKFLYLVQADPGQSPTDKLSSDELATRLSMFLWCSIPDSELLDLAASGRLSDHDVLTSQVDRMLADPRARRFSEQFVRQWLGMQLLDFLQVDRKAYPQFDPSLKDAMLAEPVAFFHEALSGNHSVLDFLHADYTLVNERLARHYGINGVFGNEFRRVSLEPQQRRGGLLTQAGLLAMNSDGKDSHPLKRGIWMLERLLNDPPPPPPPAVPRIDLADPEIAKLTLKQRIENHRNQAACRSCHEKIDPWGIALENFDAAGSWRSEIAGKPVDAASQLFNGQRLDGIDGLKRFLLTNRQDQFARALTHKLTTYALGRPLTFGDRSGVDQITADLRQRSDGLATLVTLIVTSDLFQSK